ncbi:MAG: DMT family transporter [Candidatus Peribacteraceae bacterium]|nr:DMT family transporter [Candidatus Peribacteraceae bacterium]
MEISDVLPSPLAKRRAATRTRGMTVGWSALSVMILAGSTTSSFGKQLTGTFSPLSMLLVSELLMLLFAVFSFGGIPLVHKLLKQKPHTLLALLSIGVINGGVAPYLWFSGLSRTSAINTQLFGMTEMLFLMIFASFFAREKITRAHIGGGIVISLGLLIVTLKGFHESIALNTGDIFIILSCLSYSIGGTIIRKKLHRTAPELIIFARSATAILLFFLISPFISHPFISEVMAFPLALIPVLLAYGFISRFLLVFSFYESLKHLPVASVSLLSTVVVGTALLFAHFYLGEPIHWYQAAGAALIMAGAIIVQSSGLRKLEQHLTHYWMSHHRQQF